MESVEEETEEAREVDDELLSSSTTGAGKSTRELGSDPLCVRPPSSDCICDVNEAA